MRTPTKVNNLLEIVDPKTYLALRVIREAIIHKDIAWLRGYSAPLMHTLWLGMAGIDVDWFKDNVDTILDRCNN